MPTPRRFAPAVSSSLALVALLLSGCATTTATPESAAAPAVPVAAEYVALSGWPAAVPTVALGNGGGIDPRSAAAAETAEPGWRKKFFKVGARLYPRCFPAQLTGTIRHDTGLVCLTDEELARLEDDKQDFSARFGQNTTLCGNCQGGN